MTAQHTSRVAAARHHVARVLVGVAIWVGGGAGVALLTIAALSRRVDLAVVGMYSLVVGMIGLYQRWRRQSKPLQILLPGATIGALLTPITDRTAHIALLPTLTLFAFVGILSMPKTTARLFAIWCGLVAAASVPFMLPETTPMELAAVMVMLAAVGLAGWKFVTMAGDLLVREEESHRLLFQESPVALLEEDFTAAADRLEGLRAAGVAELEGYLEERPDEVREMITGIVIRRANEAALQMIGSQSVEDLNEGFRSASRDDHELWSFVQQFLAIWEGRSQVAIDLAGVTLSGDPIEAVLHWSAPIEEGKRDLSRVIVAISDITPRKAIEHRLADALEANRRLLEFEHALALCSRSLLLGSGEAALEDALTTLRVAIGADRAYLTVNVADPVEGESFHVVRSVSIPEYADDEWMGRVVPWSRYQMVRDEHVAGRPFQHIGTPDSEPGWSRSVLTVPVHTEGRWAGTVGFMDMERTSPWSDEAVRMLEVAAPMLGTFWERETTRKRLEELVSSKDRFVASVSHELRTPLAAVLGFAEELKANASGFGVDELTDMLELIADQSQEMADMVEDLLVSARADIGTVSINPQDVYLRSQAEATLAGLGPSSEKQIRVVGGPGRVWADPSRTRQIIRNLITNAIRYGGAHVVVEAVEGAEATTLTVRDDGVGLDSSQWEVIFEPYQRAHDAPTQPASIGLGLTVSRQLARLMGGDLAYRGDGSGSVFTLTLPARSPQAIEAQQEANGTLAAASTGH